MASEQASPFKVVTGTHCVSYVHLAKPAVFEDSEPKYSITLLIPKDHEDVAKIRKALKALYDANKETLFKGVPFNSPKLWNPLRDGDEWLADHPDASEYEDCYFIKAADKKQPKVYDADKQEILDIEEEVYSGAYCRAVIVFWAFNKNGKKGFSCFLNSVMKMKDGERIGGFTATADDYDDEPRGKSGGRKATKPSTDEDDDLL